MLGSLDGSDLYLFFSSVCAAFQPSAPARLTPQGSNLQAPAGTEMGVVSVTGISCASQPSSALSPDPDPPDEP